MSQIPLFTNSNDQYFFFFKDTATSDIYTLSLHDALPISRGILRPDPAQRYRTHAADPALSSSDARAPRGQDHECRLHRSLPARPPHGRLLRHQGLRTLVLGGDRRRTQKFRRAGDLLLSWRHTD